MTGLRSKDMASTVQSGSLRRSVVLVGLMGAGKSSVGLRLANALGTRLIDSDVEIEKAANLTIPEIFERYGEPYFRDGERKVLSRLLSDKPCVIASGGGAFMDAETRALVAHLGVSVWLKADLETLVSRTSGRTHRPLLNKGNPREILAGLIDERYPVYAEADVTVESKAGQTHEDMASRIVKKLTAQGRAFQEQN